MSSDVTVQHHNTWFHGSSSVYILLGVCGGEWMHHNRGTDGTPNCPLTLLLLLFTVEPPLIQTSTDRLHSVWTPWKWAESYRTTSEVKNCMRER